MSFFSTDNIVTNTLSATTITGNTYYSGSTPLNTVIYNYTTGATTIPSTQVAFGGTGNTLSGSSFFTHDGAGNVSINNIGRSITLGQWPSVPSHSAIYFGALVPQWFSLAGDGQNLFINSRNDGTTLFQSSNITVIQHTTDRINTAQPLFAGGTGFIPSSWIDIIGSSSSMASLRVRSGSTVTSPNDGDIWNDGQHLWARISGETRILDNVSGGSQTNIISSTDTFDFGSEESYVTKTITGSTSLTLDNLKSFTAIPLSSSTTTLDDFSLNGVIFNIENIIDNTSFDIRATALNNASGIYTIKYTITY